MMFTEEYKVLHDTISAFHIANHGGTNDGLRQDEIAEALEDLIDGGYIVRNFV